MTILTKSAYARHRGWTPAYVSKLIAQGRVVLDDKKHVLVEETDAKIKATAGARDDVAARNAAARAGAMTAASLPMPESDIPEGGRARYKAMAMHYENQCQKIHLALAQGVRFTTDEVKDEALGIGNTLRATIERLIDTTAPRLAVTKTKAERARILQMEVAALRKSLKNAFPRAFVRLARKKG